MQRDFSHAILKIDGTEFEDKPTLGTVSFLALTTQLPSDRDMSGAKKVQLYALAQKVHAGGVQDMTAEELSTLKDRIGQAFGVLVVGAAWKLLDTDYVAQAE